MQNYFAAANTATGFVSWFDDIFNPRTLDFIYIIKGGSGTGKSTLMKKAAAKAAALGADCEYFYCSSDPTSLDGIIASMPDGRRFGMLDGTAPHTRDPRFPGAAEEIVNLGEYWCGDILTKQRGEIIELGDLKSRLFGEAYDYFAAAGTIERSCQNSVFGALLSKKLDAACERLLLSRMHECHVKGSESRRNVRALSALSTHGEVYFDSFSDCERVYLAADFMGTKVYLFEALIKKACELGLSFDRGPMLLLCDRTEAIRFPELSMSVVSHTDSTNAKVINMTRFVDRDAFYDGERQQIRALRKASKQLVDAGLQKLSAVRDAHAALEKIYIGSMDFTRLGDAAERLISRMFI